MRREVWGTRGGGQDSGRANRRPPRKKSTGVDNELLVFFLFCDAGVKAVKEEVRNGR